MKKGKIVTLLATLFISGTILAACKPDKPKDGDKASEPKTSETKKADTTTSSKAEAVSAASISDNPAALEAAMKENGTWIIAPTKDVTFDHDLTVAGKFYDHGAKEGDVIRKLSLYNQDKDNKVTARYTMTAPKLTVESENFNIVHGTFKGDVYVKANGFTIDDGKVEGNVIFASEEFKKSAKLDLNGGKVTGDVKVEAAKAADTVSAASISDNPAALEAAMKENGTWIIAPTKDVTFDHDLTVAGKFYDHGAKEGTVVRKLSLYNQDKDQKVTARYNMTAPKLTVESENFNIVHGTFKGDVYVKANGFTIDDGKVEGNVTFASKEFKDSAKLDLNGGKVTGDVKVEG